MTEQHRAFVFVLDPTVEQADDLASHCGAARFAYNHMLAVVKANLSQRDAERSYGVADDALTPLVSWSAYSLRKHFNTRKAVHAPWWREVSKEAFATGTANLAIALKNWSDSKHGRRAGRKSGFPGFHGKRHKRSMTFTTGAIRVEPDRHHVTLPRLGRIHTLESTRTLSRLVESGRARITRATISFTRGRWQVSFLATVTAADRTHRRPGSVVGVDLGCSDWIVAATPDGVEVARVPIPPAMKNLARRKAVLQHRARHTRRPDRRTGQAGSNRWKRAQQQIDRLDHRMANLRAHTLHTVTIDLTRQFETVVVEDLSVAGMMTRGGATKRGLNRSLALAAFATTRLMLTYKTAREGGTLVVVDRFYPSSKTCSECGAVKAKLALSERTFVCTACASVIDRDLNAAVNLAHQAAMAGSTPVTGRGAAHKTSHLRVPEAAGRETSTLSGSPERQRPGAT